MGRANYIKDGTLVGPLITPNFEQLPKAVPFEGSSLVVTKSCDSVILRMSKRASSVGKGGMRLISALLVDGHLR